MHAGEYAILSDCMMPNYLGDRTPPDSNPVSPTNRRNRFSQACALAGTLVASFGHVIAQEPSTAVPAPPPIRSTLPAAGPAELPPAPNLLDSVPQIPASPFLLPRTSSPAASAPAADTMPDAEPLWVLPPSVIPAHVATVPGARPIRDRGYLDRPDQAEGIIAEPIEPDSSRLERGLDWPYCGPRPGGAGSDGPAVTAPTDSATEPTDIAAGGISYRRGSDVLDAVGGVSVTRGSQRVNADTLSYDRGRETVSTDGNVYIEYPQLRLTGAGAEVNLATEQGRLDAPRFRLSGPLNARGLADTAYVVSATRSAYRDILYTTCPPGSNAWTLRAGKLKLDQYAGVGEARDARLRIRGVPVLYMPYLRFPIDDRRRSGILPPTFGTSDDDGVELAVPYYWNIAPHMDATITPRIMTKRGVQLGGEFRYLTRADTGEIRAEILPDDRNYDGEDSLRWGFNALEEGLWFDRVRTQLDFSAVSDDEYLEDLGNNIDATSTRYLDQRGLVSYFGSGWLTQIQVHGFQTLDQTIAPEDRPYGRLPQILFRLSPAEVLPRATSRLLGRPTVGLDAEYNHFDHNHKVHGQRITATPLLSWPLNRSWGHLIPAARVHLSSYDLTATDPGSETSPGYVIPSLDVDGKLVFERQTSWFGTNALQTLEPRLYYLYTPYADQDDAPVFDSSELDFSFASLYRNNRFTGRDRIGDANQITAGISSRMLRAASGEELFRVSLGQVYYFADRRVQIDGPTQTDTSSPYIGELSARVFENWMGRASLQWDPDAEGDPVPRRTLRLEYRGPERTLLNLAYRTELTTVEANRYEDTDLSFRLPVGTQAEMVGRWLYSVRYGETMDAVAGIEFGKCCWRMSIVGRHFKRRPDEAASTSVMLQIHLAGLGAIGDPIGEFLEREIYGYSVD
jgi:LPS-assembly protein